MSKYNQPEEFWKNYTLNGVTIIKKIGEKSFKSPSKKKDYFYNTDILLAQCSCGFQYEVLSKSFLDNKCQSCRRCATKKEDNVGNIINNLLCVDSFHKKNVSNRSIIWLNLTCQKCLFKRIVRADIFRTQSVTCDNCKNPTHLHKKIGKGKTPHQYFVSLKYGAKNRNIGVNITVDDILNLAIKQNYKCYLSGLDISFDDGSLSVDRIDSNKGYIIGNIQCVHRDINFMKNSYSQERFLDICSKVTSWNTKI